MCFKRKDAIEHVLELERRLEYWEQQYNNVERHLNYTSKNYQILKQQCKKAEEELEQTKEELNKYILLYHDAVSRLKQVMEETNYGKG